MERESIAWIIVRAFGIYFAAQVLLDCLHLLSYVMDLLAIQEIAPLKTPEEAETRIARAWNSVVYQATELTVFFLLALYCLRGGSFVHKLLMRGSSET
jgi:hypothetical protein